MLSQRHRSRISSDFHSNFNFYLSLTLSHRIPGIPQAKEELGIINHKFLRLVADVCSNNRLL